MSRLTLVIGNKNYSSWSLRAWLALKQTGEGFQEIRLPLHTSEFEKEIVKYSPSGKVPCLIDGDIHVWESLAICEYLAEKFQKANLWPKDPKARAFARSISNEMHAGFMALRKNCPMKIRERIKKEISADIQTDIDRITTIWREAREKFGKGGPFLFGYFTVADSMYAPIVMRFVTYGVKVDPVSKGFMDAILSLPAMKEWISAAEKEVEVLAH